MSPHLPKVKCCDGTSIGIILGKAIYDSSNWQHIQRLKITILGANWQLFWLERIANCLYFTLSIQNIKFYWFVMKIKKCLLPIWWYNRGLFPLRNKYFEVFVLNGLKVQLILSTTVETRYNEIPGTEKFSLLYQISCYISSQWTIQNKGNYFIGAGEFSLLYQVFCYVRCLYIEFTLYSCLIHWAVWCHGSVDKTLYLNHEVPGSDLLPAAMVPLGKALHLHYVIPGRKPKSCWSVGPVVAHFKQLYFLTS